MPAESGRRGRRAATRAVWEAERHKFARPSGRSFERLAPRPDSRADPLSEPTSDRRLSGALRHARPRSGSPESARSSSTRSSRSRTRWSVIGPRVGVVAARTRAARDRSTRISRSRPRRRGYGRPCCVLRRRFDIPARATCRLLRRSRGSTVPTWRAAGRRIHRAVRRQAHPAPRDRDHPWSGAACPEIAFRIVGSGQLDEPLRRRPENVRYEPWVEYDQLPDLYRSAGCALGIFGTSAKAARVIPNKAFQALATATPLITADTPAARELLEDERDALLVPPGDPEALAHAIRRLASEPGLRSSIGARGRTTYAENASEEVLGARWRALIERLIP